MYALTSCYARLCAVAVLIVPLSLHGADKKTEDAVRILGLVRMVQPAFPSAALADGIAEGHVTFAIGRTPGGEPGDVLVLEATHAGMADATLEAVREWRFQPTTDPTELEPRVVRVGFRLQGVVVYPFGKDTSQMSERDAAMLPRTQPVSVPRVQNLAATPRMLVKPMPAYPAGLRSKPLEGTAAVKFFVDEEGRVRLPQVLEASTPEFGEAAKAAVAEWRYEPPCDGGRPVVATDQWRFQFKANN
jgi:TonB family protein